MSRVHRILEQAIGHHHCGALDRAEPLYREILRVDPAHADALHLLGIVAHQRQQPVEAVRYIERAIAANEKSPLFHCNLGAALQSLGDADRAIASLQRAVEIDPGYADAWFNLATIQRRSGKLAEASESYRRLCALRPHDVTVHGSLIGALRDLGRTKEAVDAASAAVAMHPHSAELHNTLGTLLHDCGDIDAAIAQYQQSIQLDLQFAAAHSNLATALKETGRCDEAITHYNRALSIDPRFVLGHFNLGNLYRDLDRLDEAIAAYGRALAIDPEHVEARVNQAVALKDQQRMPEALANYETLLARQPELAEARFNRALIRLAQGDLARGWDEYEWRMRHKSEPQRFSVPRWTGTPPADKAILIHAEQGIGDEIMFASCLPDVLAQGGRCVVECDRRLVPLFSRSFPAVQCISKQSILDGTLSPPAADMQMAIGSLPRVFRRDLNAFPRHAGYLVADAPRRQQFREALSRLGDGLKVGISWFGGKDDEARRKRSIPLERWAPLLSLPGIDWVTLQYGQTVRERAAVEAQTGGTIFECPDADPLQDLDSFAALVSALDLVISVDNSTVHMAGALGVPVWTLLPSASDWRWMLERSDTPWYPSMRLIRRGKSEIWPDVLAHVASELQMLQQRGMLSRRKS